MLTFTEEEFEKYQTRIAGERREAQLRHSRQGAVSRAQGAQFEQAIAGTCDIYREKGMADIEKTPEPMRPIKSLGGGRFIAFFEKQAQPDYKGTLAGGQAVMFEAKSTATDRITQDRVTGEQAERLERCYQMGGVAFVLCQFSSGQVYKLPWSIWENMQEHFGVKYITEDSAAPYRCRLTPRGEPLFLE
jgi:recombination protein U